MSRSTGQPDDIGLSAPERFYLENRVQIEEWSALAGGVSQTIHGFLVRNLMAGLEDPADGWRARDSQDGKYASVAVAPRPSVGEGLPPLMVGVFWRPRTVMPETSGDATSPFVAIRVDAEATAAGDICAALDEIDRSGPPPHGFDHKSSSKTWPRWRFVVAEPGWWEHADEYVDVLLEQFQALWVRYADVVERWA